MQPLKVARTKLFGREQTLGGLLGAGAKAELGPHDYLALLRLGRPGAVARWLRPKTGQVGLRLARACVLEHAPEARIVRSAPGTLDFAFPGQDGEAVKIIAQRLVEHLEDALGAVEGGDRLQIALGVAPPGQPGEAAGRAHKALALAKTSSSRWALWAKHGHADAASRIALARDLRGALARDQLWVAYQPLLDLRRGCVDRVEALCRWDHPQYGAISPDVFVPLAEESGDIGRLTRFVLARAIADQADLRARGHDLAVNVNLSGRLVADDMFCSELLATCQGARGRIGLEITETAVFVHPDRALRNLRRLSEGGIPIAIDDYGTGLSSLAYLKQLPAAELKIDKLFVSSLTSSHRDPLIVRSTIDLAHALEMEVTAEGVDQPAALALLKVMGCDRAQGFHIARPAPLNGLISFLEDSRIQDSFDSTSGLVSIGPASLVKKRV